MGDQHASDDETFQMVMLVCTSLGAISAAVLIIIAKFWHSTIGWLIAHQALVPASARPRVRLPGATGAGLDTARVFVLISVATIVVVIGIDAARRHLRQRKS